MARIHVQGGFGIALLLVTILPLFAALMVRRFAPRRKTAWLALFAWILILNACSHIILSLVAWSLRRVSSRRSCCSCRYRPSC
ncbi:hypothetical protein CLG96_16625 [Sphingomonas oleivorans]|uniref:Uncharacterized protein n=2 Tax=Sphingomonas oleivorans TaxID=1735121 RepID=A0A2T5FU19_9SPHN|nr:hypothetical protein CLG96_16625 [Sphingomonas oleivorans]